MTPYQSIIMRWVVMPLMAACIWKLVVSAPLWQAFFATALWELLNWFQRLAIRATDFPIVPGQSTTLNLNVVVTVPEGWGCTVEPRANRVVLVHEASYSIIPVSLQGVKDTQELYRRINNVIARFKK